VLFLPAWLGRHAVAVEAKLHVGKKAGLGRSSAASARGGIAGELFLNGIPQRVIDDRRVFTGMELALGSISPR
jgi:hypothetical protein